MNFRKLADIEPGERLNLLTVRTQKAYLERRDDKSYLVISITNDDEVLTSSRERREHFTNTDTPWFRQQLELWKGSDRVTVANSDHPLEFISGAVCPILVLDDGEFVVSTLRDILPTGFLIPGGCAGSLDELLDPPAIAKREVFEELFIGDTSGRALSIGDSGVLTQGLQDWGVEIKDILYPKVKETQYILGDAQFLEIHMPVDRQMKKVNIPDINMFIDTEIGSLQLVLYWRIALPGKTMSNLRIWDGERLPDNTLLKRPIRLSTLKGCSKAFFINGNFVPLHGGWLSEAMEKQSTPGR